MDCFKNNNTIVDSPVWLANKQDQNLYKICFENIGQKCDL